MARSGNYLWLQLQQNLDHQRCSITLVVAVSAFLIGVQLAIATWISDGGVCVCGPMAHDCVEVFSVTEGPGVGGDLGNLARELVDLSILLRHSVHKILMIATMLVRLAGLFPTTTVMMWVGVRVWRL